MTEPGRRRPAVLRPGHVQHVHHDGATLRLCDYADALAIMDALVARPADAPDVVLSVQHPPTITLGRRGGAQHMRLGAMQVPVDIWEIARGGSVTWHAPGQLVVYPVVQLARMAGPIGRGPLGDLPLFVRLLEQAMLATCASFGLHTLTREGFSGLWLDETTKLGSIGVGLRGGWTFHGLALNVCPDLAAFTEVTPCGLDGVRMTSLWQELARRDLPRPTLAEVEAELVESLLRHLTRNDQ